MANVALETSGFRKMYSFIVQRERATYNGKIKMLKNNTPTTHPIEHELFLSYTPSKPNGCETNFTVFDSLMKINEKAILFDTIMVCLLCS